jgi:hypothetical protein
VSIFRLKGRTKAQVQAALPPATGYNDLFLDSDTGFATLRLPNNTFSTMQGQQGVSGTLSVGTVTTGAPGSSVVIQNAGTPENRILNITIPRGDTGAQGLQGDKGWSPVLAVVTDGSRRVLQVSDWTGGAGAKPATGAYVGATGLVATLASAVDIRGPVGPQGVSDVVNAVTQFGADNTGATDSTAAIQAAIDSLGAGGQVFLPKGRYKIATNGTGITFPAKHVHLTGESRADTIVFTTNATANLVTWSASAWYSGVSNIGFDNSDSASGGTSGLVARGANSWVLAMHANAPYAFVHHCDFNFHRNAIDCPSHLADIDGLNIREFAQFGGVGINISGSPSANDKFLSNITMASSKPYAAGSACIRVKQVASLRMSNLNLVGGENVLDLNPDAGAVIPSVYAVNSFFDQGSVACIRLRGAGTILRSKFTQCWASGYGDNSTQYGVFIEGANTQGLDFVGCDFYGTQIGLYAVPNGSVGLEWQVIGSRFSGNTTAAIRTSAGGGHSFSILSNRIGNGSGFGANALAIDIGAGTYESYQITDNRGLDANTTAGIVDGGTTTVPAKKAVGMNLGLTPATTTRATATTASNTETVLAQIALPANSMTVGSTYRIKVYGGFSNTLATAATTTWRVRLGTAGTTADAIVVPSPVFTSNAAATNNIAFNIEVMVTVRGTGTTGQVVAMGVLNNNGATGMTTSTTNQVWPSGAAPGVGTGLGSVNTTVANFLSVTAQTSTATSNVAVQISSVAVERA